MTQTFVPLVPGNLRVAESAGLAAGSLRPKTNLTAAAQPLFQPATPASLKMEPVGSSAPHTTHGEPKITLERQGEAVTHIRIQCGCGQVIELKCDY